MWSSRGWLSHFLGVSVGLSPCMVLNWLIFLLRNFERKLGPQMIQTSTLCPILSHNYQIVFYRIWRSEITGRVVAVLLFVEYEGQIFWEIWPEVVNIVGAQIISRYQYIPWISTPVYTAYFRCYQGMWWYISYWSQWMLLVCWYLTIPSCTGRKFL